MSMRVVRSPVAMVCARDLQAEIDSRTGPCDFAQVPWFNVWLVYHDDSRFPL